MSDDYMVSVRLMTYNHAAYIDKAISSILEQRTDFLVEIVVGDDFSTDGTLEKIQKYSDIGNFRFNILRRQYGDEYWEKRQQLGRLYNFVNIIENCSGKYIALLDGDDYWTDSTKLQKQIEFLELNGEYVLSFHQVKMLDLNGTIRADDLTKVPDNFETIDILASKGNYIQTPSVVFRNIYRDFPEGFVQSPIGDYFLYMLLAQNGKLKYIEQPMAIYRKDVGVWSNVSYFKRTFKTSITHVLLYSYFLKKNNNKIANIFLDRIGSFIEKNVTNLSSDKLVTLTNQKIIEDNQEITRMVFDILLKQVEKKANNPKLSSKRMLKILIYRLKSKIINH